MSTALTAAHTAIGGGGRYDGMVGRWLGTDVPAVGISLGFERIVDLVSQGSSQEAFKVLIFDQNQLAKAIEVQDQAVAQGVALRIELRPKNLKVLLEQLGQAGAKEFAVLDDSADFASLSFRQLG